MIFRRKAKNEDPETTETDAAVEEAAEPRAEGPFDSSEVDPSVLEAEDRIDLGALVITGMPGIELRAFAAPKKTGIWTEVRREIAAEASRMGGTATETEGTFGTELVLVVPVEDPDGQIFSQTSRVVGVDGPRWLLRATVLGRAAVEPDAAAPMEETLRNVIVVRGAEPMAVRESLPLQLPPGAQPAPDEEA